MASSAFTGRSDGAGGTGGTGLAAMATNLRCKADDFNQSIRLGLALGRAIKTLTGGEGILTGGATLIGDFGGSGTTYPAVALLLADDVGDVWPIVTTSNTAITFVATSGSGVKLYATPTLLTGITPSMADGKPQGLTLTAKASGDAAPAHSLLLGAGDVTASAFTTWVEDAGARVGALARLTADQTLSGANTFSGALIATNGKLRNVADAKFGPPTTGAHVAGELWLDAAGALWRCTASATPGTWVQGPSGYAATWTGGGADDITTAANWNGGALLDGYRVSDGEMDWVYDTTLSRWRGTQIETITISSSGATASSSMTLGTVTLSDNYDLEIVEFAMRVTASGCSAGNSWKLELIKFDNTPSLTSLCDTTRESDGAYIYRATPASPVVATGTDCGLLVYLTKTGSPGNLGTSGATVLVRMLR